MNPTMANRDSWTTPIVGHTAPIFLQLGSDTNIVTNVPSAENELDNTPYQIFHFLFCFMF